MSERAPVFRRAVARLRAIFDEDWSQKAGVTFRKGLKFLSDLNTEYLQLEDKAREAPDLAWRAVEGAAVEKHASAVAAYSRAENDRIDLALKERTLEEKVRQEKASADKLESEARLSRIKEAQALADLAKQCRDSGIAFTVDVAGVIKAFSAPNQPTAIMETILEGHKLKAVADAEPETALTMLQKAHDAAQALHNELRKIRSTNAADSETVSNLLFNVDTILTAVNQEMMAQRNDQMQAASSEVISAVKDLISLRGELADIANRIGALDEVPKRVDVLLRECQVIFGLT